MFDKDQEKKNLQFFILQWKLVTQKNKKESMNAVFFLSVGGKAVRKKRKL